MFIDLLSFLRGFVFREQQFVFALALEPEKEWKDDTRTGHSGEEDPVDLKEPMMTSDRARIENTYDMRRESSVVFARGHDVNITDFRWVSSLKRRTSWSVRTIEASLDVLEHRWSFRSFGRWRWRSSYCWCHFVSVSIRPHELNWLLYTTATWSKRSPVMGEPRSLTHWYVPIWDWVCRRVIRTAPTESCANRSNSHWKPF